MLINVDNYVEIGDFYLETGHYNKITYDI